MIVQGAHAVRHGEAPSFAAAEGMRRDLFMIERDDPRAALDEIVGLVAQRLPEHYGVDPVEGIQVFAPVYKGALGIDALNLRLRDALNPHGGPVLGGRLRIGDKLMLTGRNLHELGLMNGTMLRLLDVRGDGDALIVSADGVTVTCPARRRRSSRSPTPARSTRARASSCRWRSSSPTPRPARSSCAARCSTRR